jgi:D-alanyl-D-alanine carboxypeptidase
LLVELAACQPLLFTPGTRQRHSNIGFNLAGMIGERATGDDLATLLAGDRPAARHTAYDPQGPIARRHASGCAGNDNGAMVDVTDEPVGQGANGGIVADAGDTALFLTRLMQGEILDRDHLIRLQGDAFWNGGWDSGCAGSGCRVRPSRSAGTTRPDPGRPATRC